MSKHPGEFEPIKPVSKEEREARKAFRHNDAKSAMTEHASAAKLFDKNRERLKAERLAREADEPTPPTKEEKVSVEGEEMMAVNSLQPDHVMHCEY